MKTNIFTILFLLLFAASIIRADETKDLVSPKIAYQNVKIENKYDVEPEEKIDNPEELNLEDQGENAAEDTEQSEDELPELSFKELKNRSNIQEDEKFRGSFFPVRVFRTPAKFKKQNRKYHKMVMVNTSKTHERLFILFPKGKNSEIRQNIRKHKKMDIVYKRVGFFNSKYPVIEFVQ